MPTERNTHRYLHKDAHTHEYTFIHRHTITHTHIYTTASLPNTQYTSAIFVCPSVGFVSALTLIPWFEVMILSAPDTQLPVLVSAQCLLLLGLSDLQNIK